MVSPMGWDWFGLVWTVAWKGLVKTGLDSPQDMDRMGVVCRIGRVRFCLVSRIGTAWIGVD